MKPAGKETTATVTGRDIPYWIVTEVDGTTHYLLPSEVDERLRREGATGTLFYRSTASRGGYRLAAR